MPYHAPEGSTMKPHNRHALRLTGTVFALLFVFLIVFPGEAASKPFGEQVARAFVLALAQAPFFWLVFWLWARKKLQKT
jgi:hypothetical protein